MHWQERHILKTLGKTVAARAGRVIFGCGVGVAIFAAGFAAGYYLTRWAL